MKKTALNTVKKKKKTGDSLRNKTTIVVAIVVLYCIITLVQPQYLT